MPRRKGVTLDPEWVGLEYDVRVWRTDYVARVYGISQATQTRLLKGQSVSYETVRTFLKALEDQPPYPALEDFLPVVKKAVLERCRQNGIKEET